MTGIHADPDRETDLADPNCLSLVAEKEREGEGIFHERFAPIAIPRGAWVASLLRAEARVEAELENIVGFGWPAAVDH